MIALELLIDRLRLFCKIVGRKYEVHRISPALAWEVACIVHDWDYYRQVIRLFECGPCFRLTKGVW